MEKWLENSDMTSLKNKSEISRNGMGSQEKDKDAGLGNYTSNC